MRIHSYCTIAASKIKYFTSVSIVARKYDPGQSETPGRLAKRRIHRSPEQGYFGARHVVVEAEQDGQHQRETQRPTNYIDDLKKLRST